MKKWEPQTEKYLTVKAENASVGLFGGPKKVKSDDCILL
jgi:hypothetical protein